jgi:uncharacterized GH25 family protein
MKTIQRLLQSFLVMVSIVLFCSHDLYLKMDTYFLKPNQSATLNLYNGTFEKSENTITRDRMLDASILYNGQRLAIDSTQWEDKDSTVTQLFFTPLESATYVAGVSTKARNIALSAEKFNDYLKHDGVLDMLDYRTKNNLLTQDAVEQYEKHVKAIYQVGDTRTADWQTVLQYPIEFVPQENPYDKNTGDSLSVQLLLDGKPLANQLVFAHNTHGSHQHSHEEATHEHSSTEENHVHKHEDITDEHSHQHDSDNNHQHEHEGEHTHKHEDADHVHEHEHEHDTDDHHQSTSEATHSHTNGQQLRTDANGMVSVLLPEDGIYYLRTIYMENVLDSEELTHRSKWATLTFEVTHKHDSTTHTHDDHNHEEGIPTWWFVIGSVVVIGILFFAFRNKE